MEIIFKGEPKDIAAFMLEVTNGAEKTIDLGPVSVSEGMSTEELVRKATEALINEAEVTKSHIASVGISADKLADGKLIGYGITADRIGAGPAPVQGRERY